MNITTAAGKPAAGHSCVRVSESIQSTEVNMNNQTNANTCGSTDSADFTLISNNAVNMADQLDMDIIGLLDQKFAAAKDGDLLSGSCTPSELERWLYGYFNGTQAHDLTGFGHGVHSNETLGKNLPRLTDVAINLAAHLDIDIDRRDNGYILIKDGEAFHDKYSPIEVSAFLSGYLAGTDDSVNVVQRGHAQLLLAELVKAEQIIQVMMAGMDDAQKQAVTNSLVVVGAGGKQSACRSAERQAAIIASRASGNRSAA